MRRRRRRQDKARAEKLKNCPQAKKRLGRHSFTETVLPDKFLLKIGHSAGTLWAKISPDLLFGYLGGHLGGNGTS